MATSKTTNNIFEGERQMATTTKKTVSVQGVETEDALVVKLGGLFASNKVQGLASEVEGLEKRLEAARARLEEERANSDSRVEEMSRTVKRLRAAKLNENAIEAAVKAQFGVRRAAKRPEGGVARKSHKLDDDGAVRVLAAIRAAGGAGALMTDLWAAVPDMDRVGVQNLVRKMASENKIRATGQTRSRRYVMA